MANVTDPTRPDFDRRAFNRNVIAEYRANGGKLTGMLANSRLVLLTTTGARSGRPHTIPLGYATDGDTGRIALWASNMAAPAHPAWYRNLVANPKVTIERGTERFDAEASTATGTERDRLYQELTVQLPGIAGHQDRTDREIPIVIIEPVR